MPNSISFSCAATLIWCFSSLLLHSYSSSAPYSNETDHLALLAIRSHFHDPIGFTTSLNNSINLGQWTGVTCAHWHQKVTKLDLRKYQSLRGFLSPYVGNLSFLWHINIADNSFHGEIPREIGNLFRLEILMITDNSFSGLMPTNLSRCSNLIAFHANNNKLAGEIPEEIGCLFKLQKLSIRRNLLT